MILDGLLQHLLVLVGVCSLVPLGLSAATGLALAIAQAATQIQEQTIVYVSKLASLGLILFFCGGFFADACVGLFHEACSVIAHAGRL